MLKTPLSYSRLVTYSSQTAPVTQGNMGLYQTGKNNNQTTFDNAYHTYSGGQARLEVLRRQGTSHISSIYGSPI